MMFEQPIASTLSNERCRKPASRFDDALRDHLL
jgi:hypothetical protein